MNIHNSKPKGEGGFTLVEALIGVGIFAIVLLSILQTFTANRVTYAKGEVKTSIQQNARAALELISRELRMVGYDPNHTTPLLGAGTTPATTQRTIQSATATDIRFIADVNNPAGTGPDGWGDMIGYTYDATCSQLRRKVWVWDPAASRPTSWPRLPTTRASSPRPSPSSSTPRSRRSSATSITMRPSPIPT